MTKMHFVRRARGLRQLDLAFATRIQPSRLSLIENRRVPPRPDEVERIAAVLGIAVDELLGAVHAQ